MGNYINKTKDNKLKPLLRGSNEPRSFDCWMHCQTASCVLKSEAL